MTVDPIELAAELIRRPSVTPKDEGALDIVASRLERLGFVCHRLVFDDPGPDGQPTAPIANLYARFGEGRPNLCFAGHTDVVPTGPVEGWSFEKPRTKDFVTSLSSLDLDGKTLIVIDQKDENLQKSASNVAGVKTLLAHYVNVIDLLNSDNVVISRAAVDVLESYLGQPSAEADDDGTADEEA